MGPAKPISANVGEGSLRLKPVFLARSRTGHSMELSVGAFGATPTVVHVTALPADWQTDANTPMAAAEPIVEAFWEGEVHGAPAPESTPVTAGGARKRRRTCTHTEASWRCMHIDQIFIYNFIAQSYRLSNGSQLTLTGPSGKP